MNQENGISTLLIQDEESEMGALGSALNNQEIALDLLMRLRAEDFYKQSHQEIYRAIAELIRAGKRADSILVCQYLRDRKMLADVGGHEYVTALVQFSPLLDRAVEFMRRVGEFSRRRYLRNTAEEFRKRAENPLEDAFKLSSDLAMRLLQFDQNKERHERSFGATLEQVIEEAFAEAGPIVAQTGFVDLDDLIGGLRKKNVYIIAGRPSMGKSSLSFQIAQNVAKNGIPVLIFSLEMSAMQVVRGMVFRTGRIDSQEFRPGQLTHEQKIKMMHAASIVKELPLEISDSGDQTVDQMMFTAIMAVMKKKCGLIIVDYVQLIRPSGKYESRQIEVSRISASLKSLAKQLDVPLLLTAQLNRESEMRADYMPRLADLRESGAIEQDADVVMLLYRPGRYKEDPTPEEKNLCKVIVGKNREGRTGIVELVFIDKWTRFENKSHFQEKEHAPEF